MCYHHHDIAFRVYPANKGGSQPIKKRIFSAFLSAALLLSLTPWAALAAENPATQVEEQELQTRFQSPPQDPDIYSDPQPSIQVPETPEETPENPETPEVPKIAPEVVPEVQTAPVAVQAAETHENHDACAAGVCNVDNHSSRHVTTEWTPVSSLSEIRGNGFYYLTQDVIQSGKWNVPASSNPGVILCLNGDLTYSFKIDPKPVTVTAKDQVTRIGQPLAALTYTCDPAPCAGDSFTGELATNANKDQLSDQYTISQGDLSLGNNYTITFVPGKYTVTDKLPQPDFKFGDGLISKTYGDEPFTVAATGAAEGSTVSYTSDKTSVATVDSDGHVTIVGAGEATITATAAETADYVSASASYTLTVARAELTITAKNQSAYVGDAAPELGADSYTVEGLVNGDALTTLPTVQYVDENGQPVEPDMTKTGETIIRASGAAASGNYDLAYVDGKLTVSTRPSSGGGGGGRTPTYPVTTPSGVDSSKKSAAKGDVVTITVKPEPGFEVEEVIVTDAKGNQIKVTANADGTFSFIQPDSQVEVQTVYAEAGGPFRDVARSDYFYDAVTWAKDNNITGGVGDDLFGADRSCTRARSSPSCGGPPVLPSPRARPT